MAQLTYAIDPAHSAVHFSVRHMMLSNVRGEFTKLSGTVKVDSDNPANSSIDATIDTPAPRRQVQHYQHHYRNDDFHSGVPLPA